MSSSVAPVSRISLIASIVLLFAGSAMIAWMWRQAIAETGEADLPTIVTPSDFSAVESVRADPAFAALVPLAPPLRPSMVGNPNPFTRPGIVPTTP